jgi:hypothetical protein
MWENCNDVLLQEMGSTKDMQTCNRSTAWADWPIQPFHVPIYVDETNILWKWVLA